MQDTSRDEQPILAVRWQDLIEAVVRIFGIIVAIVGLVIAGNVLSRVWQLYDSHAPIIAFAKEIDDVTSINKAANTFMSETIEQVRINRQLPAKEIPAVNITYFMAWGIKLLLLMVIAWIGFTAIAQGGKLAVVGLGDRKFALAFAQEAAKQTAGWQIRSGIMEKISQNLLQELRQAAKSSPE